MTQVLGALCTTFALIVLVQHPFGTAESEIHVLTTNDVHGSWFSAEYDSSEHRNSLQCLNWYVDSIRNAAGERNVILLDAGDCLQGDNASFYYNFVDTLSPHLFPRLAKYMRYDAIVVGNHDIETGPAVYDRVGRELERNGIPFLAGNALRADGNPYFPEYTVLKKAGLKVLLLGYTNANMKSWLDESKLNGLEFRSLIPLVQERVDALTSKIKPDVVIVAAHCGTGLGDGQMLENQGLDLLNSLHGVDLLVCAHDHNPCVIRTGSCCLTNSGSRAANLGHAVIRISRKGRKVLSKQVSASLIGADAGKADGRMVDRFADDFIKVKEFSLRKVGKLECELRTSDAYCGMCDYLNFIHSVQLKATGAQISFAAPLTFDGRVPAGDVVYNDLMTIYPYENSLYTITLSGKQIKDYLERSYDSWIGGSDGHVLNIVNRPDPRTGAENWSFVARSYNFDSVAGIVYEVWPENRRGERVTILSMADGSAFDPDSNYTVALTSYRANGGGGLLEEGAGVSPAELETIVTGRYPDIRQLVYEYFTDNTVLTSALMGEQSLIGRWSFEPAPVRERMAADSYLVFNQ